MVWRGVAWRGVLVVAVWSSGRGVDTRMELLSNPWPKTRTNKMFGHFFTCPVSNDSTKNRFAPRLKYMPPLGMWNAPARSFSTALRDPTNVGSSAHPTAVFVEVPARL